MKDECIRVTAPARLHFGMLSFENGRQRRFGGLGLMVERPAVRLHCTASREFEVVGPLAERVRHVALNWSRWRSLDDLPPCRLEVRDAPQHHTGLGTGTQLGLAVAAGLNALLLPDEATVTPAQLAAAVGRGHRSAVGTYGFHLGGLILESGKLPGDSIGRLEHRVAVPATWQFALLRPLNDEGLSGGAEDEAFALLKDAPASTTERLGYLARHVILPAAKRRRFDEFAEGVYDYGYLAGSCYASIQGGAFAGPQLTQLVRTIREIGVRGVGQTSWGPTVFAVLPDEGAAHRFADRIRSQYSPQELSVVVTRANNSGADINCGPRK